MPRPCLALAMTLLLLSCHSDDGVPRADPGPERTARAKLLRLAGDVKVKRATGDEWLAAQEAMALYENDKVRTPTGARCAIEFSNGSSVELGEDALIGIAETRPRPGQERTDLTILKGKVNAELPDASKQSLTVSTPAATVRAGREIVFQ